MTPLDTERLHMRRITVEDAPFMLRLLNEPSFLQNIGDRGVRTIEDSERYIINGPIASYERHNIGAMLVTLKGDFTPIGICGLLKRDTLDDYDLGYAFVPEAWSKGFAVESSKAVLRFAREVFGLKRVVAATNPDNQGSIRVLEKLGFEFERMVRLAPEENEIKLFGLSLDGAGSGRAGCPESTQRAV